MTVPSCKDFKKKTNSTQQAILKGVFVKKFQLLSNYKIFIKINRNPTGNNKRCVDQKTSTSVKSENLHKK